MRKFFNFIASCLAFIFCCSLIGCSNNEKEIIELTLDNWKEYLAYQESSNTSAVSQTYLYGIPYYKSEGTYTVKFYPISDVKFENVNITINLQIYTSNYVAEDKSGVSLKDRIPDDWYFVNAPYPTKDSLGGTTWTKCHSGTLSSEGEISFSEACKMSFLKTKSWKSYDTLEDAITVSVKEIYGQVVIEK